MASFNSGQEKNTTRTAVGEPKDASLHSNPGGEILGESRPLAVTDGEVNFILGFIHDGSIGAEPWHRLIGAWGYCERHAWASFAVEMSTLRGFVSRSAFLYSDLLRHAVAVLGPRTSRTRRGAARLLEEQNPCMICEINPRRRGWLSDAELAQAKDQTLLNRFAEATAPLWMGDCCPHCIGDKSRGPLCRHHLVAAIRAKQPVDLDEEYRHLSRLLPQVETYARSFMWGYRDSDGPEHRAALLSAIGWCSG